MGLDGVELILACEEEFGISISDADGMACFTPRDLIDLISRQLAASETRECITQQAFHILRRALVREFGIPRRDIRPDSELRVLLAGKNLPQAWADLRRAANAKVWPGLVRPRWLKVAIWLTAFAALGWVFYLCLRALAARLVWAPLLAGTITGAIGFRLTARYCTRLPADCPTLASLFPYVEKEPLPTMTRDRVAAKVKTLVIDHLGLREGQYREDAQFVRDLGLD